LSKVGVKNNEYFTPVGYSDFAKQDPDIAEFGNAFHKLASYVVICENVEYPESMAPWVNNLYRFLKNYPFRPIQDKDKRYLIEYPMRSKSGFCGTPDLVAYNIRDEVCVVDWKTSSTHDKHYRYQTAAYSKLVEEVHGIKVKHRYTVCITDKSFSIEVRTYKPEDLIIFSSCLNLCKMV
jgi:hypothetical protein